MRVCVLGNSHAAALKQGFDSLNDKPGRCEVTFFASRADGLRSLVCRGGKLLSPDANVSQNLLRTSGGQMVIDPGAYDLFLIHALEFRYDYALLQSGAYTQGFIAAWMWQSWMESTAFHVLKLLLSVTDCEIVLSPQPYASAADERIRKMVTRYKRAAPSIGEIFADCRKPSEFERLRMLEQPDETIVDGVLTKPRYSRGSVRLDVGDSISGTTHPEHDHRHMNGEYGAAVWRHFAHRFC